MKMTKTLGWLVLGSAAAIVSAQEASTTPAMSTTPSGTYARTPGMGTGSGYGSTTPGTGRLSTRPGAGTSGQTPDTSRSSMPAYQRTPVPGGSAGPASGKSAAVPTSASDCSGDAWRNFSKPKFKDEGACQVWVQKHSKKSSTAPAQTPSAH